MGSEFVDSNSLEQYKHDLQFWAVDFASNNVEAPLAFEARTMAADNAVLNITRVSVNSDGIQGNSDSFNSISADGLYVAFASLASNLVNSNTNDPIDHFRRSSSSI